MTFIDNFWDVSCDLAPWLLIGAAVTALLHRLLPAGFISKNLQGRSGVVKATLIGVPLPLCSCGVIPAGIGLKKDGASDGSAVAFLISTPQTGVDSVLVSAAMLGWPFAVLKIFAAAVTGIIGGIWVDTLKKSEPNEISENSKRTHQPTWSEAYQHGIQLLRSIWVWLFFGILISALLTTFLPEGSLEEYAHPIGAAFAALLISTPLYVCATASVPIAASLVAGGLPLGAALVFLMAGPATNAATIGAIKSAFGLRNTLVYLSVVILGSLVFGLGFDFVISNTNVSHMDGHQHDMLPSFLEQVSGLILYVMFLLFAWEKFASTSSQYGDYEVAVEGMTCMGCVSKLKGRLLDLDGVEDASVQLDPGLAIVSGTVSGLNLYNTILQSGFKPAYPNDVSPFSVHGMTCQGCVGKLSRRFSQEAAIRDFVVDFKGSRIWLQGNFSQRQIVEIIEELGFSTDKSDLSGTHSQS